jgi:hypothetical protein
MKTKKRRIAKKSSSKRKIAIVSIIAIAAIIIISPAIYQQTKKGENTPKKDPEEYFQFLNTSAFGKRVSQNVVRIESLFFALKPVGGDAHNVAVILEGYADPLDYWRAEIKNGTEEHFEVQLQYAIQVYKQDEGYPIKLKIRSDEAEGKVTLFLKEEDIITYS